MAALDAEARRVLATRSAIVEDVLRSELPRRLSQDLLLILDVEAVDDSPVEWIASTDRAATEKAPPALPAEGATNSSLPHSESTHIVLLGDSSSEASRHGPAR
jgi:hypothetical protein